MISRRVGSFRWINQLFPDTVLFGLDVFLLAIFNLDQGEVMGKGRRSSTR